MQTNLSKLDGLDFLMSELVRESQEQSSCSKHHSLLEYYEDAR
jgi:hypothetical protein